MTKLKYLNVWISNDYTLTTGGMKLLFIKIKKNI